MLEITNATIYQVIGNLIERIENGELDSAAVLAALKSLPADRMKVTEEVELWEGTREAEVKTRQ